MTNKKLTEEEFLFLKIFRTASGGYGMFLLLTGDPVGFFLCSWAVMLVWYEEVKRKREGGHNDDET